MPLTFATTGQPNTVKKICGKDETRRFLESLGFTVGGQVVVVTQIGGNLIVNVRDSRNALSTAMASRIMI